MKIIKTIQALKDYRKSINNTLGFVPTMGALHEGHTSLINQARKENEIIIVSIFVNPTQFLENEDFTKYPNKYDADIKICELCKVDAVFIPDVSTMYSENEVQIIAPILQSYILEGFNRPGHFDGVLQIVLKLFNLISPNNAYFGKKDAQQVKLIEIMCEKLFLNINIVACEIIRDENGLALSSRNIYLNKEEKVQALKLSQSLRAASNALLDGQYDANIIKTEIQKVLDGMEVEYVEIVSQDFQVLHKCDIKNTIIVVAVKIGKTRLLDNLWI